MGICNGKYRAPPAIGSDGTVYVGSDRKLYASLPLASAWLRVLGRSLAKTTRTLVGVVWLDSAREFAGTRVIVSAEYFINTDPGEGNGTAIAFEDGLFNSENEGLSDTKCGYFCFSGGST